ncbi:efflux RND transporter permease subunit [Thioclava sp. GXIMD4216]|uniref:Efflux RND transporter permease subunit n=1 Tax=Thioclava litoralis TaxID=3076557 RepID=A0ABZ1DWK9_9RHOB|nr:efflux RND transporter permease subunit [Thioclava sp. FTW29]
MPAPRGLISLFTRHATLANIVLVVMLCAGVFAAPKLRAQFFPDTVTDEIDVTVTWEGAGPEDVDRAIVQVLEPSLLTVEGVASSESTAREGRAEIELEFEPGWDMGRAMDDVENAIQLAGDLPEAAETPEIRQSVWRDTVTDVVITGPLAPEQLGRLADEMMVRLYAQGVTRTTLSGMAAPQTVVEVPTTALMAHNVSLTQIISVIGAAADATPAGDVASGASRVRAGEERREARQIRDLVIRTDADGAVLTVGDVAQIRVEGAARDRAYYVGKTPAMTLNVARSAQGDAIALQRKVEQVVAQMRPDLPAGTTIALVRSRTEQIVARLDLLVDNGVIGLVLVLVLLFLFLNARTAIWVAMGIPASLAAGLAVMYVSGMTLNMMSLFALILTLGIIVDDAIVVGEHADFRARHLGEAPAIAAENGARRMLAPVFASTLTTVIAFAGLVVIGGRMGDMIVDIPLTVIAVLAASLVECFLILPNHMYHALTHLGQPRWYDAPSRVTNRGLDWFRRKVMRPLLRGIIHARYPVLAFAVLLLAVQVFLLRTGQVQWRFFAPPERSSVSGAFAMVNGTTRKDTFAVMGELQDLVSRVAAGYEAEYGRNPVTYVIGQIGGASGRDLASADTKDSDQLGSISIELIDQDLRPYSSADFIRRLQEHLPDDPMLEELAFRSFRAGPAGDSLSVQFTGAETRVLKEAAEALKAALAVYPEVSALEDNLAYDKEDLILALTPQGQALGFDTQTLGQELRARLNGTEAATYPDGVRSASIRVELPDAEKTADFVDRMLLQSPNGQWVPLSDIVTVRREAGFSTIRRDDGLRQVEVTGDISEDNPERANAILTEMQTRILPDIAQRLGVTWLQTGQAADERAFMADAKVGLVLCLLGIYVVLAWILASWARPLVVMSVIPFGLVGAVWGHYIWDFPMSMFAVVGGLGMVGIIINDAIVLISTVDDYARTRGLRPAIVDAVADRLRPVLLTTLTTVLGLAPLLYEGSAEAQFLKSTVITLVYGLGFGMVIVLLLVPAVLAIQADIARLCASTRRGLKAPRLAGALWLGVGLIVAGFGLAFGPVLLAGGSLAQSWLVYTPFILGALAVAAWRTRRQR